MSKFRLRLFSFILPALAGFVANAPIFASGSEEARSGETAGNWEGWHLSLEDGVEAAGKSGKPIFILFTGTGWCSPCETFNERVLDSEEFINWSKGVELVVYDLPANYWRSPLYDVVSPIQHRTVDDEGVPNWALLEPDGETAIEKNWGAGFKTAKDWIQPVKDKGVNQ